MPDQLLQQKIFPYDGAQDSTKNPILISPKDVVDSNNIVYTTYSTKKLRPGLRHAFSPVPAIGKAILGQIDFWRLGKQRVVFYDGNRIHAIDPQTGNRDDISGANVIPVQEAISFEVFSGLLIAFFTGKQTPPKAWTMSGDMFNLGAAVPNAPFGRAWLNSLWIPDPNIPGRLLKSQTGNPTLFTGGDSLAIDLDVNDQDPDGITAIFPPFFGSLYVAKRLSIYKITPVILADGSVSFGKSPKISDGIGCISHNAAVAAESQIFFPSDWGWHIFESTDKISGVDTDLLSRDIQPKWVDDVNFLRSSFIQSVYDRSLNSILCIFPPASYLFPADVWGYSLAAGKWYRWKSFNHTSVCRYLEPNQKRLRTLMGSADGSIGILDQAVQSDYGQKYGCSFQSGLIVPSGAPDDQFAFNYLAPLFVPQVDGMFTVTYKIDGRVMDTKSFEMTDTSLGGILGVSFTLGETALGGLPQIKLDKREMFGNGMAYQLYVKYVPRSGEDLNTSFEMIGIFVDVSKVTKGVGERVA